MAKVRNLSDTQQQIAFTEHDFYQRYEETFKTSELGRIKSHLPGTLTHYFENFSKNI